MTKKSMQLFVAASILAASFMTFAFTPAPKDKANGGGIAGGVHFNFTAVENTSGTIGHFSWNGTTYEIECVYVDGNSATIYFTNGFAVNMLDGKGSNAPDQITAPFDADDVNCSAMALELTLAPTMVEVTEGNLTVHK